jgi:hypothetical protein
MGAVRGNTIHLRGFGFSICCWVTPSPVPPRLEKAPVAVHPLPQGGEGSKFKSMSLRSPRRQKGRRRGQKNQINSPLAPLGERDRG